jgi:arsenate reductase
MPAPLGNAQTKKMPKIDVFGLENSAATRNAVRFFRERRIVVRFFDLRKKPIDAADFRAFLERLGAGALLLAPPAAGGAGPGGLDSGRGHLDSGGGEGPGRIESGRVDRGALLARVRADATLLRLPLVRYGAELTAGPDETTWKAWLAGRR